MKVYRLFGTLGNELKFEVHEWLVEKESEKTIKIVHADGEVTKRLNKDNLDRIQTNTVNRIDSLISFNVFTKEHSKIEQYKTEITEKILNRVIYYEEKLMEKKNILIEHKLIK